MMWGGSRSARAIVASPVHAGEPGAASGRLRDAPNGDTILAAVPNGTNLQVLFGRLEAEGNMWVQVRLESGTEGWMAEFLLRYTVRRP